MRKHDKSTKTLHILDDCVFFFSGKLMEPVLGRLDSEQLVVMKDDNSVFIDCNGAPTYQQSFPWSEAPTYLG